MLISSLHVYFQVNEDVTVYNPYLSWYQVNQLSDQTITGNCKLHNNIDHKNK